jgi:two-component system sensor histidine kinase DegS
MRIVEAQEAERARLAQEIHDGPAQALSNAIFQVEYIERVLDQDVRLARTELRYLRELLRRDLGDVRNFISRLRPPLLDQVGLDGALRQTVDEMAETIGVPAAADLGAPEGLLRDAEQTVVLRVTQEALQNVRKHAAAASVSVVTRLEDGAWVLEVRDDGRGFDIEAVAARGRRNFGLQFMRERADLIGAAFDVRSRPDGGTVVRLVIPTGTEATAGTEEST